MTNLYQRHFSHGHWEASIYVESEGPGECHWRAKMCKAGTPDTTPSTSPSTVRTLALNKLFHADYRRTSKSYLPSERSSGASGFA